MSCLGLDPEGFTYDCWLTIMWKTASTKTSWVCFQYPSPSCVPMHQMQPYTSISSYHIFVKCHGQWLFGIFSAVLEEEILPGILCVLEIIIINTLPSVWEYSSLQKSIQYKVNKHKYRLAIQERDTQSGKIGKCWCCQPDIRFVKLVQTISVIL